MKITVSVAFALAFASIASAATAGPTRGGQDSDDYSSTQGIHWTNPMVIDARPLGRGAFASLAEYYSDYKGRKMEMKEIIVGAGINDRLSFWLSRQNYLIKGRSSASRFRVDADSYGAKWIVRPPSEEDQRSIALEFEAVRPDTASAVTSGASATFRATKNNRFALDYGFANGLQAQLGYGTVQGAAVGDARIYTLAVGKDFSLDPKLSARLQGQLVGQSYTDTVETVNGEIKTVLYGALGYQASSAVRIELDGSLFPGGMPLQSGRFTSLSSFQIYRPGGVAEGLRRNTVAFASLRLVLSAKF